MTKKIDHNLDRMIDYIEEFRFGFEDKFINEIYIDDVDMVVCRI